MIESPKTIFVFLTALKNPVLFCFALSITKLSSKTRQIVKLTFTLNMHGLHADTFDTIM